MTEGWGEAPIDQKNLQYSWPATSGNAQPTTQYTQQRTQSSFQQPPPQQQLQNQFSQYQPLPPTPLQEQQPPPPPSQQQQPPPPPLQQQQLPPLPLQPPPPPLQPPPPQTPPFQQQPPQTSPFQPPPQTSPFQPPPPQKPSQSIVSSPPLLPTLQQQQQQPVVPPETFPLVQPAQQQQIPAPSTQQYYQSKSPILTPQPSLPITTQNSDIFLKDSIEHKAPLPYQNNLVTNDRPKNLQKDPTPVYNEERWDPSYDNVQTSSSAKPSFNLVYSQPAFNSNDLQKDKSPAIHKGFNDAATQTEPDHVDLTIINLMQQKYSFTITLPNNKVIPPSKLSQLIDVFTEYQRTYSSSLPITNIINNDAIATTAQSSNSNINYDPRRDVLSQSNLIKFDDNDYQKPPQEIHLHSQKSPPPQQQPPSNKYNDDDILDTATPVQNQQREWTNGNITQSQQSTWGKALIKDDTSSFGGKSGRGDWGNGPQTQQPSSSAWKNNDIPKQPANQKDWEIGSGGSSFNARNNNNIDRDRDERSTYSRDSSINGPSIQQRSTYNQNQRELDSVSHHSQQHQPVKNIPDGILSSTNQTWSGAQPQKPISTPPPQQPISTPPPQQPISQPLPPQPQSQQPTPQPQQPIQLSQQPIQTPQPQLPFPQTFPPQTPPVATPAAAPVLGGSETWDSEVEEEDWLSKAAKFTKELNTDPNTRIGIDGGRTNSTTVNNNPPALANNNNNEYGRGGANREHRGIGNGSGRPDAKALWDQLIRADAEKDLPKFKRIFEEYTTAAPVETFQSIVKDLISANANVKILALDQSHNSNISPMTSRSSLVDLQGNRDKKYLVHITFDSLGNIPQELGRIATSEFENYELLAQAGLKKDDTSINSNSNNYNNNGNSPLCYNCNQKGHISKNCPDRRDNRPPLQQSSCQNCGSLEHPTKFCRENRNGSGSNDYYSKPYESRHSSGGGGGNMMGGGGNNSLPRKCYKCNSSDHIARNCAEEQPSRFGGGSGGADRGDYQQRRSYNNNNNNNSYGGNNGFGGSSGGYGANAGGGYGANAGGGYSASTGGGYGASTGGGYGASTGGGYGASTGGGYGANSGGGGGGRQQQWAQNNDTNGKGNIRSSEVTNTNDGNELSLDKVPIWWK